MRVALEQSVVEGPGLWARDTSLTTDSFQPQTRQMASYFPQTAPANPVSFLVFILTVLGLSAIVLITALSPQHRPPNFNMLSKCISVPKFTDNLFVAFILIVCFLMMTETP